MMNALHLLPVLDHVSIRELIEWKIEIRVGDAFHKKPFKAQAR